VAGSRRRSRFVEEAVREHLRRERLSSALRETAGSLEGRYPEWETSEQVSVWVAGRRTEDEERLRRKLRPRQD
jgi:hypothetical protein